MKKNQTKYTIVIPFTRREDFYDYSAFIGRLSEYIALDIRNTICYINGKRIGLT